MPRRPGSAPRPWLVATFLLHLATLPISAQSPGAASRRGVEFAGFPVLNYDSDEGFGYGALVELYDYGAEGVLPYRYTLQPTVILTTEGRRDFTLFFDAPKVLPGGWRLGAFAGIEKHIASPFYGIGNETPLDATLSEGENPYWYRFGRTLKRLEGSLQRPLGDPRVRVLLGAGVAHTDITAVSQGEGSSLVEVGAAEGTLDVTPGWANHVRAGLVWDTRDREAGPRRGTWSEVLVQRVDERLGSRSSYTRWTLADRRYFSLGPRLVLANRLVLQGVSGDAPFHELQTLQTSFKQQQGLGGSKTLRGVLKNRFTGKGMFLWNAELRLRLADFSAAGRSFHADLSGFVDSGRVWPEAVHLSEVLTDLHHGVGGGLRLGMGDNFIVAFDAGTGSETGMPIYIGLGWLF